MDFGGFFTDNSGSMPVIKNATQTAFLEHGLPEQTNFGDKSDATMTNAQTRTEYKNLAISFANSQ